MGEPPAEAVRISQQTLDDTFAAVKSSDFQEFRDAEFTRLSGYQDPAEFLIKQAFEILINRIGEQDARRFMVGSLIITRSLYVEAVHQGITIKRPDTPMVEEQVRAIAGAIEPGRSFELTDMYDEFPDQQPLCTAVNGLNSPATRVGSLTMMGVYAHHLIAPGHKMTLRIDDVELPGLTTEGGVVAVSPDQ